MNPARLTKTASSDNCVHAIEHSKAQRIQYEHLRGSDSPDSVFYHILEPRRRNQGYRDAIRNEIRGRLGTPMFSNRLCSLRNRVPIGVADPMISRSGLGHDRLLDPSIREFRKSNVAHSIGQYNTDWAKHFPARKGQDNAAFGNTNKTNLSFSNRKCRMIKSTGSGGLFRLSRFRTG